jgi:hypothetical protein
VNQAEGGMNMAVREVIGSSGALGSHGVGPLTHIELDPARQLDDGLSMLSVLEQRIFDRLGAADEQAAIEAVLLLGDPLSPLVAANEDDGGGRAARGRFDEFHFCIPSERCRLGTHVQPAPFNILCREYDFEGGCRAIS